MSIRYTADQLQRKFPGSAASPGFARVADAMRAEGRLDEAVSLCLEGLRARPHVAGYVVLGKTHMDAGRLVEAREQFEAALRLDPRCLSAMRSLALIMDKLQWGDAAAGYYRSILEVEPWDAEIRSLLEGSGSTGTAPAASAPAETSRYAPPAPTGRDEDTFAKPDGLQGDVMEVNLNDMADEFLPSGNDVPNLVSLEDSFPPASGTSQFPASDFSPSSDSGAEPRPMDMLSSSTGPETLGENAPAPISGSDVEDRLDSIFGQEDGGLPSATATWTAAAPRPDAPPEASATATGELRSLETASEFPEAEPFDLADLPGAAEAAAPESRTFENSVSEVSRTAPSGEEPEYGDDRVQGEDIERRLDELFNLTGEEETPKPTALSASDLPVVPGPNMGETVIMGAAVAFGDRTDAAPSGMAPGEIVTGQDVADKLDSMLGPDPKAKESDEASMASSATATTAAPAALGPFADLLPPFSGFPAEDEPAPQAESAQQIESVPQAEIAPSFGEETILSTESMSPAGWQVDAPQVTGADVEAQLDKLFNLEPDPPPATAEPVAQADREPPFQGNMNDTAAADARDTLILPSEEVFPSIAKEAARNEGAGVFDTLAPEDLPSLSETASIEMVDGGDVAERLDKLFADAATVPAQEEPVFEPDLAGLPDPFSEPDVTMEMPIVKLDESAPAAEEEDSASLFSSSHSMTGNGAAAPESDLTVADARWDGTPSDAASAAPVAPVPELAPMLDEEDGYPAEEEMPAQAAGANVATVTLAEIYFQQGLKEQALQIYRQLQEREPENESVRKRIAEIEASKAEGDRGPDSDPRWPRPGLKVPKRKK